jgi:hypothetical protein
VERSTKLPEARLASLYDGAGFGGETTQRAKVIRELIDEIRQLRAELGSAAGLPRVTSSRPAGQEDRRYR